MKRLSRTALVLVALAIPTIAFAQKMVISAGPLRIEVSCDAVKATNTDTGKSLTCAEVCKKIDEKPFISCEIQNGKMVVIHHDQFGTAQYDPGQVAHVALAIQEPVIVTTDDPATIHGVANQAVSAQVKDAEGNVVDTLDEVDSFSIDIYEGERLVLSSPFQPAEVDLWIDADAAPEAVAPGAAPVVAPGADTLVPAD